LSDLTQAKIIIKINGSRNIYNEHFVKLRPRLNQNPLKGIKIERKKIAQAHGSNIVSTANEINHWALVLYVFFSRSLTSINPLNKLKRLCVRLYGTGG
jgi:hypothetical protein